MSTARHLHHSYAEYLRVEEMGELRHEFFDGEIYALAGGTPEHGALAVQVGFLLKNLLKGCTALSSDVRVRIEATGLTTYPDLFFVCAPKAERASIDGLAIINPSIVVEVTSPSTEEYDRGDKLAHYQQVPSLKAVLIVSHAAPCLTVVERGGSGWVTAEYRAGERARVQAVELEVDEVYRVLSALTP
jgi:Uma2 family endonuclease